MFLTHCDAISLKVWCVCNGLWSISTHSNAFRRVSTRFDDGPIVYIHWGLECTLCKYEPALCSRDSEGSTNKAVNDRCCIFSFGRSQRPKTEKYLAFGRIPKQKPNDEVFLNCYLSVVFAVLILFLLIHCMDVEKFRSKFKIYVEKMRWVAGWSKKCPLLFTFKVKTVHGVTGL